MLSEETIALNCSCKTQLTSLTVQ